MGDEIERGAWSFFFDHQKTYGDQGDEDEGGG